MNNKIKQMVYAALLTALAIIIPVQFGFLRVVFGPFSATLASHVPLFMAIFISPYVAAVVGLGSTLGFVFTGLPAPIVARAATHILVFYVGAKVLAKTHSYIKASIITAPLHGIAEALVVIPFVGFDVYQILVVVGLCAILHHIADCIISYVILKALAKARRTDIYSTFGEVRA
ncbi:MAG: ECF transporter S component [Clostridiaceae bacterium]|nr:ECF transporter S component [Clostridiaceae bacterium]